MVFQKAQLAIEFITTYSWAFLLILLVALVAFYYLSSQQPAPQCNFGADMSCQTFKFFKNSSGNMGLVFQLSNGMGKVITFNGTQTINVTNVGKTGTNSYTGYCWSTGTIVQGGDPIYCSFNITDTVMVPSINKNVKFDVVLNYVDCETSPNYPNSCVGGVNRTSHGAITATFEAPPAGMSYCWDGVCTADEACDSCPADCGPCGPGCLTDCSMNGICNQSCTGVCSGFKSVCNSTPKNSMVCADSSGGTTGAINYLVKCCRGPIQNCGNMSYCTAGSCATCSGDSANCNLNSSDGCEVPSLLTNNSNCGYCGHACTGGQTCQGGTCITPADYYQNTTYLCGYYISPNSTCGSGRIPTYCASGTYYPRQSCSSSPTYTSCQPQNSSDSCAVCGNCSGTGTCNPATCGTTNSYGCNRVCKGGGTGLSYCITAGSLHLGSACLCNDVCASGLCSGGICQTYTGSMPSLCGYYSGSSSACSSNPATYCAPENYLTFQPCTLDTSTPSCQPQTSSDSCAVCGNCSGTGTCNPVACGTTNGYGCAAGYYCSGGIGGCNAPFLQGALCNCSAQCGLRLYCNTTGVCSPLPTCTGVNGPCDTNCTCPHLTRYSCPDGTCTSSEFCTQPQ
ncbi:MAG: hypothetical protein NTY73_02900 [Candidatus Micrarchaeota archaeon]|nr:hypothetical protein [Candidatus Micrarchaeota archaeon]